MSRPKQSSELEALSDSLDDQDHRPSAGPMSESVSVQGPQGRISPYKFLVPCLSVRVKFTNQ